MAKRRHHRNSTSKKPVTVNTAIADDQFVISDTEDNFQKAAYELNEITAEHTLTISAQKTKLMTFK